jgi:hypothetical protein
VQVQLADTHAAMFPDAVRPAGSMRTVRRVELPVQVLALLRPVDVPADRAPGAQSPTVNRVTPAEVIRQSRDRSRAYALASCSLVNTISTDPISPGRAVWTE